MMPPSRGATEEPGVQSDPTTPQPETGSILISPLLGVTTTAEGWTLGYTTTLADASAVETIRDSTGTGEE
jgi:hypothetical protein